MRNWEKLSEIFPNAYVSCMKICPAMIYGYTACPFKGTSKNKLINAYDTNNEECIVCSRLFLESEYDGAENIEAHMANVSGKVKKAVNNGEDDFIDTNKSLPLNHNRPIVLGHSPRDCETFYECRVCGHRFTSWTMFRQKHNENDTEKYCPNCKAKLIV